MWLGGLVSLALGVVCCSVGCCGKCTNGYVCVFVDVWRTVGFSLQAHVGLTGRASVI
jgi:hypothetical protein